MKMQPLEVFINRDRVSDKEFKKYVNNGNKYEIDIDFYLFIKTLEHNSEFIEWLKRLRKKGGFPENGIDWRENPILIGFKDANEIDKKFYYSFDKKDFEHLLNMLPYKYKFTLDAIDWSTIVISHAVRLPSRGDINLQIVPSKSFLESKTNYSFEITFKRHFTKEELIRAIEERWEWMRLFVPRRQQVEAKDFKLKERDIFLLQARDFQELTFNKIADKLTELFPQKGVIYTEDSAKTAYHRAKSKAELSFSESNGIDVDSEIFTRIAKSFVQG